MVGRKVIREATAIHIRRFRLFWRTLLGAFLLDRAGRIAWEVLLVRKSSSTGKRAGGFS